MLNKTVLAFIIFLNSSVMVSANTFMDKTWAEKACNAWNKNTILTEELAGDVWMGNNARGYKLIQMYRTGCGEKTKVQLKIEDKNGKAICVYGGLPDGQRLSKDVDYLLQATDKRWTQMANGEYGPFKAMMFGYLEVKGPFDEAMYSLKPFSVFLKLMGSIPGKKGEANCPVISTKTSQN